MNVMRAKLMVTERKEAISETPWKDSNKQLHVTWTCRIPIRFAGVSPGGFKSCPASGTGGSRYMRATSVSSTTRARLRSCKVSHSCVGEEHAESAGEHLLVDKWHSESNQEISLRVSGLGQNSRWRVFTVPTAFVRNIGENGKNH